jgi:hypothetical protein
LESYAEVAEYAEGKDRGAEDGLLLRIEEQYRIDLMNLVDIGRPIADRA